MANTDQVDSADVIRVMVATDNHLGYAEKDAIRGEDSFRAFEEILEMAVAEDVDFILLGGDLFHDAVPTQNALHKCMKLLRRYTFGDKPIPLEFLSDQTLNFHSAVNQTVNYEDPNLNISIPVFSIHGNHDDPSGFGRLSSLDLLSTSGLVNYFGRWTDLTKVEIKPLLLRKGQTQLALYGLSHIHDARLARLFESCKVTVECPSEEEGDWFHLMTLHQNRADRGPKNYLPEEILPNFLHLVIWGHEHDCRIEPEYNPKQDFYVSQPGSSVPTSLAEGEALKKHVGLLEIYKTKFQMKPLQLKTVRPFVFESVHLGEMIDELGLDEGDASNKVREMAEKRVEKMIKRAEQMLTGHPKQPKLPLIRLRIIFTSEDQMFNAIRFGQTFNERVANPADMVHFKKCIKRIKQGSTDFDKDAMNSAFTKMEIETSTRVEDLVDRYFEEVDDTKALKLVSSRVLSELCYRLVDRKDTNAAERIIDYYKEKAIEHLMETLPQEADIGNQLLQVKEKVTHDDILKVLDERGAKPVLVTATTSKNVRGRKTASNADSPSTDLVTVTNGTRLVNLSPPKTARGRGRGRGGARGGAAVAAATNTATRATSSSRAAHAMPELDVSVGSKRSSTSAQKTLLDAIGQRHTPKRATTSKQKVYVISDDSDD